MCDVVSSVSLAENSVKVKLKQRDRESCSD